GFVRGNWLCGPVALRVVLKPAGYYWLRFVVTFGKEKRERPSVDAADERGPGASGRSKQRGRTDASHPSPRPESNCPGIEGRFVFGPGRRFSWEGEAPAELFGSRRHPRVPARRDSPSQEE